MKTQTQTKSIKPADVVSKWYVIDAEGVILGRLAAVCAKMLRGKHKPSFTPHVDCGDTLVVINADKVQLTGRKRTDSKFYWHTGHPGGIKDQTVQETLEGRFPERVVQRAVLRMLPKTTLGRSQMSKLKVYAGSDHPHAAQQPEVLDVGAMNRKNTRSA